MNTKQKFFRRAVTLLLAVVLCMGLTVSVGAAEDACSIEMFTVGSADQFGAFLWGGPKGDAYIAGYLVYDFLFFYNRAEGKTESFILDSWEYTDSTTLEMTLKDGITFSDGTPMTAEDVLFSCQTYLLQEQNNFKSRFSMIDFDNSYTDGNKIVLKFLYEYGPGILSTDIPVYCKAWAEENGYDSEKWLNDPLGSGPFVVEECVNNAYVLLARRADYWGDNSAYPEHIKVVHYAESSTMFIDLETGALDMACNIANADYKRSKNEAPEGITVDVVGTGDNIFLCVEADTNEYLSDENVRKAIALGTDWAAVTEAGYGDIAKMADSIINSGSPYYEPIGTYEYDPETAKQILSDAGYEPGQINFVSNTFAVDLQEDMLETIQYYLGELGIGLELNFMEPASVVPLLIQENGTDMMLQVSGNGAPAGEPQDYLGGFIDGFGFFPVMVYKDPTLNEYLKSALYSVDPEVRKGFYTSAAQYSFDHYLLFPIAEVAKPIAYKSSVVLDTNFISASYPNLRFCTFASE